MSREFARRHADLRAKIGALAPLRVPADTPTVDALIAIAEKINDVIAVLRAADLEPSVDPRLKG